MSIEYDDRALNIIGNNVKALNFYDDNRVLQARIFLDGSNNLNIGNFQVEGDGGDDESSGDLDLTDVGFLTIATTGKLSQERVLSAGAGLTSSDGGGNNDFTLNVGAGDGINVAANSIAVDVTDILGSGLTESSNNIDLGTPGTLTAATSNGVTASSHTHAITASADPGAAESILKSTASGGLTLQTMAVEGNVDITSGGDLTVGSNILFVDASGSRVGINRAPDAQFQLDIDGNIRWSGWGVGKMAIQLEGALMICHYDGPELYKDDYTGTAAGHRGQAATWNGGVIFRPGKFGTKAVQLAIGATNRVRNPSFETGTSGWSFGDVGDSGRIATLASPFGTYSGFFIGNSSTARAFTSTQSGFSAAATVTAGVRVSADSDLVGILLESLPSGDNIGTAQHTGSGEFETLTVTGALSSGETQARIQVRDKRTSAWSTVLFDAVNVQELGYVTPHVDGSLDVAHPDGTTGQHSWSGTEHGSVSTRNNAYLTYPTSGNLKAAEGTVSAWVNVESVSGEGQYIMHAAGTSAGDIRLQLTGAGTPRATWGTTDVEDPAGAIDEQTWTHLAMTYDGSTLALFVNGSEVDSASSSGFSGMPTTMTVGRHQSVADTLLNGYLDDLVILDRAADADEIRSIYESDAPVFAETSTFHWQAPGPAAIWTDEEGLYGRGSSGAPIIGLSTVDGKSWGGLTLDEGDFLLGNSADDGYLQWDLDGGASGGTLTIKGTVDQLDIANGAVVLGSAGIEIQEEDEASSLRWMDGASMVSRIYHYENALSELSAMVFENNGVQTDQAFIFQGARIQTDNNLWVQSGWLAVRDGVTAPSTLSGYALIYVDSSDGDLKVKFSDGTVKTIVTDT